MKWQLTEIRRKLADRDVHDAAAAEDLRRVATWLQPRFSLIDVEAADVRGVLRLAADTVAPLMNGNATLVYDALLRRELAASTALGSAFAIPHARLPGIAQPLTVFLRLREPVEFGASDGAPVTFVLVIIVPKDGEDVDHLRMLSLISELFSQPGFRQRIRVAPDADAAQAVFGKAIDRLVRTAHARWVFG